jgi:putative ABC transport system permease protein
MAVSKKSRGADMSRLPLFYRLMVRPLLREPVRLALTVLAVALGVAVVLAIDLAGNAATGSFHSSMETLAGDNDLEIVASGGLPENIFGQLSTHPYPLRLSPRVEDFAVILATKETLPLIGIDFVAEGGRYLARQSVEAYRETKKDSADEALRQFEEPISIWMGTSSKKSPGDTIELLINDQTFLCTVRGVYSDANGSESAILMDIAAAQRVLRRFGRLDRVLVKLPKESNIQEWQQKINGILPEGIQVREQGAGTEENRKMLTAFRWNLRLLSYIALVVGAFLIFNTISVSVVRRRPEIGIVRALGATQRMVWVAFLGEAVCLGLAGALLGLPLGRMMAAGAVKLMALTVQALYVSSRPGPIALTTWSVVLALLIGVGVAVVSAISPAREAMQVSPVEAMARGRREYIARTNKGRDLWIALVLAAAGTAAAKLPAIAGKPLFGYLATILLIAASAFANPAIVNFISLASAKLLGKLLGVEGFLASRSLAASLRRTSVLVGALSTAIAMMVSVGIMVGSFRQTVMTWMNDQLPADLYLRPAGDPAADRHPTISLELSVSSSTSLTPMLP